MIGASAGHGMPATGVAPRDQPDRNLYTSARQLRTFIDEAPVAIAMFDRDMRYLAASGYWIENICHGERDVIGRSHYDIVPDVPEHWKDTHRRALAGESLRSKANPLPSARD